MRVKVEFRDPSYFNLRDGDYWHVVPIKFSIPGTPHALLEFVEDMSAVDVAAYMALYPDEIVDWRFEHTDYRLPPYELMPQHGALAVGDTFQYHGVNADVLSRGRRGEDAVIAVLDTGTYVTHIAFDRTLVTGDFNDGHGHGTHVASTAASNWGVAPRARILSYKVLSDSGSGSEFEIANGIRAAVDAGAHIISMSLGGSGSSIMDDACNYAKSRGVIVVCAAGNGGGAPIGSPARAASIIVMAHDRGDAWAGFTDGRNWTNPNRIGANGVGIDAARAGTSNGVTNMSGTSMATPHVSGLCALLYSGGKRGQAILDYVFAHRVNPPDGPGKLYLRSDFGSTEPVPPPPTPVPPPPPPEPVPSPRVLAVDASFDLLTPEKAEALKAAGVRLFVQCLWTGTQQPANRVINLRNAFNAGLPIAGYVALTPSASGSIHVSAARSGVPQDLWDALIRLPIDVELQGLSIIYVESALRRAGELGKRRDVYTNYNTWVNYLGNPPKPANCGLWNAFWDDNPDFDFPALRYGSWLDSEVWMEQFQSNASLGGLTCDLNMVREDALPTPPAPPPPPPPAPERVIDGIGVHYTDGTTEQVWP